MNYRTIELQLLQLEESFSKSRSNIYSDKKKETHFSELHNLFIAIKESNYRSFDDGEINLHFQILTYIFKGLEFLDNSTLNIIPYEIISCLQIALDEWITEDNFIIVTSLSNRNLDFLFESENSEFFIGLNTHIERRYKLNITNRLIKIVLPKVLSRDYLSIVVLYHELGHFVDTELHISEKIIINKYGILGSYNESQIKDYNHFMEYFADLFAAQYINNASNLFLSYISFHNPDSHTHPSTKIRVEVVNDFLSGRNRYEIQEINQALIRSGYQDFKIRHTEINIKKSDFQNLIPQRINNNSELHYIFKLGWDFWNTAESNFLKKFNSRQKYHVINNLIEKSISNYTIKQKWQEILSEKSLD
ncbi:hypothetical protein [Pseudomonas shirazensis]